MTEAAGSGDELRVMKLIPEIDRFDGYLREQQP